MALPKCKRGAEHSLPQMKKAAKKRKTIIEYETLTLTSELHFPLLELPIHLVYDIISRLSLKTIFSCKCVSKTFLKIIKDPYFAKVHLTKSPSTATTLIIQECCSETVYFRPYLLNLDNFRSSSPCTTDYDPCHRHFICGPVYQKTQRDVACCFFKGSVVIVGSCNGLLCLASPTSGEPLYCVCNPMSLECMALPPLPSSASGYKYLKHSGFGFCPKTRQYKVIRFMVYNTRRVALVHTLGTESWRSIWDAPCPQTRGSFDPSLRGALHWITDTRKTSDLLCSFDLEKEKFQSVPLPAHFSQDYASQVSWISVGLLRGCLCVCYTVGDARFEVWVMKDYGVRESWLEEFVIDIKFYCGVRAEDLQQPIKFLHNGDLWFLYNSKTLVSYSHGKRTFKEIKTLGREWKTQAIAYIPSFVTLENAVLGGNLEVKKMLLAHALLNNEI